MHGLIIEAGETINQTKVFFNGARLEGITHITMQITDRHAAICMNIKADKITKQQILKDISPQVFTKGMLLPLRIEKQVQNTIVHMYEEQPIEPTEDTRKYQTIGIAHYRYKCDTCGALKSLMGKYFSASCDIDGCYGTAYLTAYLDSNGRVTLIESTKGLKNDLDTV